MSWGAAARGLRTATELVTGANAWSEFFGCVSSAILSSRARWTNIQQQPDNKVELQMQEQLQGDLWLLRTTLPKMYDLIERLEWQFHKEAAAELLPHVKDAVYDAEDLLDEFDYYELKAKVEGTVNECNTLHALQELFKSVVVGGSNKVKEIQLKLDHLYGLSRDLGLHNAPQRFDKDFRPETSFFPCMSRIFGREDDMSKVVDLLGVSTSHGTSSKRKRNNVVDVLPIVGLGGVGKTTLAQQICNNRRVKSHFNMIIWICVSDEFDVKRLTKEIIHSSGYETTIDNLASLQTILSNVVKSKRFLLVLDDIWDDVLRDGVNEWMRFCAPLSNAVQGSMILTTTRSQRIADKLRTIESFQLHGLEENAFREFFKEQSLGSDSLNNNQDLEEIGRKIVPKLKGSPLAAKTLGRLLRLNLHATHWNNILNSELWTLKQGKTDILPALRLSYIYLPYHLKRCFSLCALYPKDYMFEKDVLIDIWVAEGFVELRSGIPVLTVGSQYFEELVSRSFFQKVSLFDEKYVMHDLVHDLAQLVAKNECFVIRDACDLQKIHPDIRHLSISARANIDCCDLMGLCRYKKLHTLMCSDYFCSQSLIASWFAELQSLHVVSIFFSSEIPDSINNLKHLRYLQFTATCTFEVLPQMFNCLYYLQILDAPKCEFRSLPDGFSHMIHLRKLKSKNINYAHEDSQCLHFIREHGVTRALNGTVRIDGDICINICHLRSVDNVVHVEIDKKNCINSVSISLFGQHTSEHELVQVLEVLHPHRNIKQLELHGYQSDRWPSWFIPANLPNLTSLIFEECDNCPDKSFPRLPCMVFLSLTNIYISNCKNLSCLEEFLQPDYVPCIKKLSITWCGLLESVAAERFGDFHHLEELEVSRCPRINWQTLAGLPPSLRQLTLIQSGKFIHHFLECLLGLNSLTHFTLADPYLTTIPLQVWTSNLPALERLELTSCFDLISFNTSNNVGTLSSLTTLLIDQCNNLSSLEDLITTENIPSIKKICISYCGELSILPAEKFGGFLFLEDLEIQDCPRISWRRGLLLPQSLRRLSLVRCGDASEWISDRLVNLPSLMHLQLIEHYSLTSIPEDNWLKNLQLLHIQKCPRLLSIGRGPEAITQISNVFIDGCKSLKGIQQPFQRGDIICQKHIPRVFTAFVA